MKSENGKMKTESTCHSELKQVQQRMCLVSESRTPEVRFKGFSEEWEEKKLGDEAIEIIAGGDIEKERITKEGKYPIYANALTNDGVVGYYDDYYRVKAPAVTVTGRGEFDKKGLEEFQKILRG